MLHGLPLDEVEGVTVDMSQAGNGAAFKAMPGSGAEVRSVTTPI